MLARRVFLLTAALVLPLALAADPAGEYEKRLGKLRAEEASGRFALARHCEGAKMWKQALAEYEAVLELAPDTKAAEDKITTVAQKAGVSTARPSAGDEKKYTQGLGMLRASIAKKYRDLAVWAKAQGLEDEALDATAAADTLENVKNSTDPRQQAIDYLNRMRRKSGLPMVTLSERLSDGAQKHCEYLVRNNAHPSTSGLGAHNEMPSLPGYTPEGERAGHQSDIGQRPPVRSMAGMFGVFYHRIPLLHPDLREVGIGWKALEGEGTADAKGWCSIDYSGRLPEADAKAPRVTCFPAPGQKRIPREFCSKEMPDPIPSGEDQSCGTPVTITWHDQVTVEDGKMEVTLGGTAVKGYLSSPSSPARSDFPNENSICFMSEEPMLANKTYKVKVTATVGGEAFEKTWEFTTGAQMRDE
jgi:hypothetical protein